MKPPVTAPCKFCGRDARRDENRIGNVHAACAKRARARRLTAERVGTMSNRPRFET